MDILVMCLLYVHACMQEGIPVIIEAILAELSTATDHDGRQKERREDMLDSLCNRAEGLGYDDDADDATGWGIAGRDGDDEGGGLMMMTW